MSLGPESSSVSWATCPGRGLLSVFDAGGSQRRTTRDSSILRHPGYFLISMTQTGVDPCGPVHVGRHLLGTEQQPPPTLITPTRPFKVTK